MMSTNPFRPGGKDDAHQGSGPRNAVANAGSSETTRQTFTDHDLPKDATHPQPRQDATKEYEEKQRHQGWQDGWRRSGAGTARNGRRESFCSFQLKLAITTAGMKVSNRREEEARGRRAQGRKGVVDVGGGGKEWHRDCWCVGGEEVVYADREGEENGR